ncbi:5'/3'-nucleotidase SurE [Corallococcus sp. H22C18031201]|uniref:5'/3'-nucleotidase SurE n=1 Tax=Citreicoccus inhibens TaxID=2849499 RepID=UPI000E71CAA8|nr:5'/3'-nucleotidase SurE [Citreicoccus inhibens]MBU8897855.1 5'/3'-nucleotidase SurE [Citreicoccus inhibens]RJS24883.1 5'/3'-nucleotidase SurE [Corallococcus sp. H22C18031201]
MSAPLPRILVSNDDGYFSEGLHALVEAVSPLGEVWVVAPDREQSAASHAISLHRPLRIKQVRERWFAVDGTPTDCSYLALVHLLKDARPQLMVSGINHGSNLADDVTYSGTVAAAMEAAQLGVPSIAFSLVSRGPFDFGPAARFARSLAQSALSRPLPPRMLLNVNIPGGVEPDGYIVTRLGRHSYGYDVVEKEDPRGRKYYWIGGTDYQHEDIQGSDCNAVHLDKRVSVTPLHLDLTDHGRIAGLTSWTLDGFQRHDPDGA